MQPLYLARIEDLGQGDFVKVDCAAWHHVALLTSPALLKLGLRPHAKVLDLKHASRARSEGTSRRFDQVAAVGADHDLARLSNLTGLAPPPAPVTIATL